MEGDSALTDESSDLSSIASMSPIPDYPSPVSSQDQESANGACDSPTKKRAIEGKGKPVVKKRKRSEPKPRTTERLDLSGSMQTVAVDQKYQLERLLKVLRKRRKIVVIAGAGISVSAGSEIWSHRERFRTALTKSTVPDFRSSTGLFKSLKSDHKLKASGKQLFDASVYQTDSSTSSFHDMVRSLSGLVSAAKPTEFHQMLSQLGSEGRLMRLYTQNVDGIDVALPYLKTGVPLSSKGPWPRSIQLHGGLEKMVCSKCHALSDFAPELFNGPEPPPCTTCIEADRVRTDHAGKRSHGIGRLRPRIVLYNEHNPDEEAIGAVVSADLRARPDALVVVGTSMKIPGVRRIVREMCGVVRGRRDGLTVWINQDGPPMGREFEDCWDLIVRGPCDEVAKQWALSQQQQPQRQLEHQLCTSEDVERAKAKGEMQVVIRSPNKSGDGRPSQQEGILTPAASPHPKSVQPPKKPLIRLTVKAPPLKDKKAKPRATKPSKPSTKAKTARPAKKPPAAPAPPITSAFKLSKAAATTASHSSKLSKPRPFSLSPTRHAPSSPPPCLPQPRKPSMFPNLNLPALDFSTPPRQDSLAAYRSSCSSSPLSTLSSPPPPRSSPSGSPSSGTVVAVKRERSTRDGSREGTVSPRSVPRGMEKLLSYEEGNGEGAAFGDPVVAVAAPGA